MEPSNNTPSREELYKVPFPERWELLKPVLKRLYFDEKRKLPEIISLMKSTYDFDASEAQFKYQFNKKWGWKKSIPSSTKEAILKIAHTRAAAGKLTLVKYKNKEIDLKKIRRHAKQTARQDLSSKDALEDSAEKGGLDLSHEVLLEIKIFLIWNRIFEFEGLPILGPIDIVPSPACAVDPIDLTVETPPAQCYISQSDALYLHSSVMEKKLTSRAHLFIQGRYDELIHDIVKNEMKILSTWLYQYWQFAFHTAKFWGNGPLNWTAENLKLRQILTFSDPPLDLRARIELTPGSGQAVQAPKNFCYWSIHISDKDWKNWKNWKPRGDLNNLESTMEEWPEHLKNPAVEKRLQNALNSNSFSNIKSEDLPMALHQLTKTINKSTNQFLQISLSFSIMAGNYILIKELLGKAEAAEVDLSELFPYHLATSYLDGSVQCCRVFGLLCRRLGGGKFSLARCYTDHLGHSVLDNLMIAILKGHTSITPGIANNGWRNQSRFAGDEIDICGRWAPDSNELATVLGSGVGGIPLEWKHKFCHTSVQVILHCIQAAEFHGADLNTSSGLYLKFCFSCGSKLQLQPLHTLIFTAFQLAQFGRTGEDLFGIIACLLCLLQLGVDPSRKSTTSTTILLDQAQDKTCCHSEMTPLQLADSLGLMFSDTLPTKLQVGWKIICHLLGLGEAERDKWELRHPGSGLGVAAQVLETSEKIGDATESATSNGYQIGCDDCIWGEGFFGNNKYLGHIWAAVQTELLTHRRRQDGDHWMSENFDMDALLGSLELDSELAIGFVKRGVMKKYCSCGSFTDIPWPNLSLGKQVTASILESNPNPETVNTTLLDPELITWSDNVPLVFLKALTPRPPAKVNLIIKAPGRMNRANLHDDFRPRDLEKELIPAQFTSWWRGCRSPLIDSLCIIQDSDSDWETESARMAEVYLNSLVTLAATASLNSSGGCLFPRSPIDVGLGNTETDLSTGEKIQLGRVIPEVAATFVRKPVRCGHDTIRMKRGGIETGAPLLSRVWVYQETVMSRRTVHFHSEELIWECREDVSCECGYFKFPEVHEEIYGMARHITNTWKSPFAMLLFDNKGLGSSENMLDEWYRIIDAYSGLKLTHDGDRLPALAGLASRFAKTLDTSYLAGLWLSDLWKGLLWRRHSDVTCHRLSGPKATISTWSWASIIPIHDTTAAPSIEYSRDRSIEVDDSFTVLSAKCPLLSKNTFGQVNGGLLQVKGALAEIPPLQNQGKEYRLLSDNSKRFVFPGDNLVLDIVSPQGISEEVLPGDTLHCLTVGYLKHQEGRITQNTQRLYLVLKNVQGRTFKRVGFLSQTDKGANWLQDAEVSEVEII